MSSRPGFPQAVAFVGGCHWQPEISTHFACDNLNYYKRLHIYKSDFR